MIHTEFRLVAAHVKGLFGEYDHSVILNQSKQFAIIYGPNGIGKTKFLEIIHALSRLEGGRLSSLPFQSAILEYSNKAKLSATPQAASITHRDAMSFESQGFSFQDVEFCLQLPDGSKEEWKFKASAATRMLGGFDIEPVSNGLYRLPWSSELLTFDKVMELVPQEFDAPHRATFKAPCIAKEFAEKVPSFLIETQRLRIDRMSTGRRSRPPRIHDEPYQSFPRITEQSNVILNRLQVAQTEHSKITQQLDRTFPRRVLEAAVDQSLSEKDILRRYDEQNKLRARVGRVASVLLESNLALPEKALDEWALKLLNQYLNDTDKKLAPFDRVLRKIDLLEDIINSRLLNKVLQVTAEKGISVEHKGNQRAIPLDRLSSGEQHEIILMTDLLFNVPSGALVLIDEPEISLHVAWQLSFIPDVKRIADLVGFRFIVATHSPQIVNGDWDHTISLGAGEETANA